MDTTSGTLVPSLDTLAIAQPAPFSTVAAPTAAYQACPLITFSRFSELATELRAKIWNFAAVIDPQVVHAKYNVHISSASQDGYFSSGDWGTWRFETGITSLGGLSQVCQESRAETKGMHDKYEIIRLRGNVTEARWFNFETDTLFLSSNTDEGRALPPKCPLDGVTESKLRRLAISRELWEDWEFIEDHGPDVSCEMFQFEIFKLPIEKFQLVMNSYGLGSLLA